MRELREPNLPCGSCELECAIMEHSDLPSAEDGKVHEHHFFQSFSGFGSLFQSGFYKRSKALFEVGPLFVVQHGSSFLKVEMEINSLLMDA